MMRELDDVGILGDYHLLLAHKILERPLQWMGFFKKLNKFLGVKPFVIVDNSLIELGYPLEAQQIADAATAVNADVVVLPDILRDRKGTVDLSVSAMEQLRGKLSDKTELMGVVQGSTWEEYIDCANDLINHAHAEYLAIPRVTTEVLGSRIFISYAIHQAYPETKIHLLGFSDNIADDICTTICTPNCIGIDSSLPMRLGCEGKFLRDVGTLTHNLGKRPSDWLDDESDYHVTVEVRQNVSRIRGIIA